MPANARPMGQEAFEHTTYIAMTGGFACFGRSPHFTVGLHTCLAYVLRERARPRPDKHGQAHGS